MYRRILLAMLLLFAAAPLRGQQAPKPGAPPDAAVLQRVLDAWGTMDVSHPAPYYAKDANLAFYDVAPRKYTGWSEYAKGAGEMFTTLKSLSFRLGADADIHRSGNLAWTTALVDAEMVNKDGTTASIPGRWTTIWEKRGNDWLIVHDHFSMAPPAPKQ